MEPAETDALGVLDVRPFIGSLDFDASRDFYVALGWRVTYDSERLRVLELAGHRFYLQKYYNREWCHNTMLHVTVQDVDAWFHWVTQVFATHTFPPEARVSEGVQDEGYARTFHVWDPAGVLLHFAQLNPT